MKFQALHKIIRKLIEGLMKLKLYRISKFSILPPSENLADTMTNTNHDCCCKRLKENVQILVVPRGNHTPTSRVDSDSKNDKENSMKIEILKIENPTELQPQQHGPDARDIQTGIEADKWQPDPAGRSDNSSKPENTPANVASRSRGSATAENTPGVDRIRGLYLKPSSSARRTELKDKFGYSCSDHRNKNENKLLY